MTIQALCNLQEILIGAFIRREGHSGVVLSVAVVAAARGTGALAIPPRPAKTVNKDDISPHVIDDSVHIDVYPDCLASCDHVLKLGSGARPAVIYMIVCKQTGASAPAVHLVGHGLVTSPPCRALDVLIGRRHLATR